MSTFVEQKCTIEHNGRTFSSGGAVVTPDHAIGYLSSDSRSMNDWHGNRLGSANKTSV